MLRLNEVVAFELFKSLSLRSWGIKARDDLSQQATLRPFSTVTNSSKCLQSERPSILGGTRSPPGRGKSTPSCSPHDGTDRRILDVKDLELKSSWKRKLEFIPEPERLKKYRPWAYEERMKPANDAENLPEDWHMNDDDLDPRSVVDDFLADI